MDLSLTVFTKPVLGNLVLIDLSWEAGISNGLSMEPFMFAQLLKFWIPEFKLISLIRTWICSIVVHGHLCRFIIIIISVNVLMIFFIIEVLNPFTIVCRLSPVLLHSNLWTFDFVIKDWLNSWSETSTIYIICTLLSILSQIRPVDFVDVLDDIQILHHMINSLVFSFTIRSLYRIFLAFGFESVV